MLDLKKFFYYKHKINKRLVRIQTLKVHFSFSPKHYNIMDYSVSLLCSGMIFPQTKLEITTLISYGVTFLNTSNIRACKPRGRYETVPFLVRVWNNLNKLQFNNSILAGT